MISPFARRHHIDHELYDHTSILAMIEWRWGLAPLTPATPTRSNLARRSSFHRPPDLTAPQWRGAGGGHLDRQAQHAVNGPSEHEQDWLRLGELAAERRLRARLSHQASA